ncbi:MAG: hypothetical protein DMG96_04145 [Acidobacteria bacterium]|nr:MAG: hypothetical protein DMG96_04145 [Acidobacteriota bacterium]
MSPEKFEAKWRGVRIAGQEVFADVAAIFLRANADDLKVETLYASVGLRNDWAGGKYRPPPLPSAGTPTENGLPFLF